VDGFGRVPLRPSFAIDGPLINDVETLLHEVPQYGPDLALALREREERKKGSRGWFLDFVDRFLP
jgi:hypothetical protein